jgi:predicted O-methyltransferase YrrM
MEGEEILKELEGISKTLVWYSPSQIEIGQHLSDPDGIYGDRPWPVSPETGEFLYNFILKNYIKNVVELGTGIGYSGVWMGLALKKQSGKLFTIEKRDYKFNIAKDYFKKADINAKIFEEEIETALPKIVKELQTADLLFFDANRSKFIQYLKALSPIITEKTFLIVDNTTDMKERLETFKEYLQKAGWKIEELETGDGLWICTK